MNESPAREVATPPPFLPPPDDFSMVADLLLPLCLYLLLGSLVWFLLDLRAVLFGGPVRLLRWIFGFFMLAVVGIARIGARDGRFEAAGYAGALLLVMGLFGFLFTFGGGAFGGGYRGASPVGSLLFLYAVIAVIWVGANYLVSRTAIDPDDVAVDDAGGLSSEDWSRFGEQAAAVRRTHPGQAVMILSLFAMVLFGLGHKLLAGHDAQRHAYLTMVLFCGSALMTLALSALSGLQIYARRRGTRLQGSMIALWLSLALPLTALLLGLAHLTPRLEPRPDSLLPVLPRPLQSALDGLAERLFDPPWSGDGPGQGATGVEGDGSGGADQGPAGETPGQGAPNDGAAGGPGTSAAPNDAPPEAASQPGDAAPGGGGSGESGQGYGAAEAPASGSDERPTPANATAADADEPARVPAAELGPPAGAPTWLPALLVGLGLLLALGLLTRLVRWLAQRDSRPPAAGSEPLLVRDPFVDPFGPRSPFAGRPPAEIVRHVYRAFQAYCQLLGRPRQPNLTAHEFLLELPASTRSWRAEIEALTDLYAAVEYTSEGVDERCLEELKPIWERLMTAVREVRGG